MRGYRVVPGIQSICIYKNTGPIKLLTRCFSFYSYYFKILMKFLIPMACTS